MVELCILMFPVNLRFKVIVVNIRKFYVLQIRILHRDHYCFKFYNSVSSHFAA